MTTEFRLGRRTAGAGFSLIEIMVGMVVALLATLVITQVLGGFEGQKRLTTGTADAQTNGAMALQSVLREVQVAGSGLALFDRRLGLLDCAVARNLHPLLVGAINFSPIQIVDDSTMEGSTSDSISIRYGTTMAGGVPTRIGSITGNTLEVDNTIGCSNGDTAVISNGGSECFIVGVEDDDLATDTTHITLADHEDLAHLPTNQAVVSCVGAWRNVEFRVDGDRLLRNGEEIAAGIVNLQAQYGVADGSPALGKENEIVAWVDATGTWETLSVAERKRIKAVRVAVVARNGLRDKDVVSVACSALDEATPTGVCAWGGSETSPAPEIDLSSVNDWDHYRYRVFESIIPLRNVIWAGEAL